MKKGKGSLQEETLDEQTALEFCKIHEQAILDSRPVDLDMKDFIDACEEKRFLANGR